MPIVIPYKPRRWAKAVHEAVTRWIVLIICRRGGKTTSAFNHVQRDALRTKNSRYAYIAPTHRQAKRIVWKMAKYYSAKVPGVQYNESELLIKYANGSEIMILGASNADSLRGLGLWGVFLDEFPQMSPIIFSEIIVPCLADHQGYCIFGGTPKGKGHFYTIYKSAKKHPDRYTLVFKTIDDLLKEEQGETINELRKSLAEAKKLVQDGLMTEDEFQQEWYNSFEASLKGAVYIKQIAEARQKKRISRSLFDSTLPVFTVWDLGVSKSDAMSIGFFQRVAKEVRLIDYYENTGLGLPHYIRVVKETKKEYTYAKHFAPHDILHKELTTGKTRLSTAEKLGINFEVVANVGKEDGIDLARAMWKRLWVDETTCETFLDLIGQYRYDYDELKRMNRKTPMHDFTSHAADMLRYAAVAEDEMEVDSTLKEPPPNHSNYNPSDEYVGHAANDSDEPPPGFGRHPVTRNIKIGLMGHPKPHRANED